MGFELMENFNTPYFARNIRDFGVDGIYHLAVGLKIIYIFL